MTVSSLSNAERSKIINHSLKFIITMITTEKKQMNLLPDLPENFENWEAAGKWFDQIGCTLTFEPEEEDLSPDDMFDWDYGNGKTPEENKADFYKKWEEVGSPWWFCAKVSISFNGIEGTDYLGGCNYNSFEEFKDGMNGYMCGMIHQAYDELQLELLETAEKLMKDFVLIVHANTSPEVFGPFPSEEVANEFSENWRDSEGDQDGVYPFKGIVPQF
jgi:hypothetical protein